MRSRAHRFTTLLVVAALLAVVLPGGARTAASAADTTTPVAALAEVCAETSPAPFRDRDGAGVHTEAVDCVAGWGIAGGRADGRFDPGGTVTRAQLATFTQRLLLAAGVDLPAPEKGFDDTAASVHRRAIERLATAGVVAGRGDGTFDPNAAVSRAQAASILANALTVGRVTLDNGGEPAASSDVAAGTTTPI
ncbi:MAG: S-layer homology domain-containing protein, partial [Nitriliruptoraceae bacterium]